MKEITDLMGNLSKGDISTSTELPEDSSETGLLVSSYNKTRSTIKTYIDDIDEKLENLA